MAPVIPRMHFPGSHRHERNRSEVLTKSIVQFLPETLLFTVADFKNFALKPFAPGDLGFQFFIRPA